MHEHFCRLVQIDGASGPKRAPLAAQLLQETPETPSAEVSETPETPETPSAATEETTD